MAPKKGTKGQKAQKVAEEQPPLPEEQPPLPDEAPPLPDEAPPLPVEQPPLPDEQPPLPNEQPPLPDEQPPLPNEQPPLPNEQPPLPSEGGAQPITSLGEGEGDDDDGEDDSDDDDDDEGSGKDKGKGKETDKDKPHPWQAVWAPANNAYYFWNTDTGEVTWTNPVAPASDAPPLPNEPPPLPSGPAPPRPRPAGALPDIDPALAHLLPAEQRDGSSSATSAAMAARTGRLGTDSHYAFAALDEYSRQKRFNEHYFDVDGWEKAKAAEARKRRAEEEAGTAGARKITKKDMDRFRAKKAEQKQRRQAWLYD